MRTWGEIKNHKRINFLDEGLTEQKKRVVSHTERGSKTNAHNRRRV